MTDRRVRRPFLRLVGLVARRDYVRTVRRRGFLFGTALLPVGIVVLMLLSEAMGADAAGPGRLPGVVGAGAPVALHVVNGSALPVRPIETASVRVELVSRSEAVARLERGAIQEAYVVPDGYPESGPVEQLVRAAGGPSIEALARRDAQATILTTLLHAALLERAGLSAEAASEILAPIRIETRSTTGEAVPVTASVASFLVPYAFTLLFVMSIFITSGYLLQSVTEEKENRVVEIILSSVPALPLMAGKIIGLGAAGLTQVGIWLTTALVAVSLGGERPGAAAGSAIAIAPVTVVLALVYFTLGYLGYGAIFSAVGAIAPGSREAQQYAGFFGFFAVVPLIFTGVFLTDLGSPIVTVLAIVPLTAPAAMLQVLSLASEPPWALIAASLASMTIFTLLATIASARIFRATLLLHGVRPGVRQLLAAARADG
jgi:ABC-2 type transport system permease protein